MTAERMTCPTCGRDVAARMIRGPRVNAGRPIPPIRMPVHHKQPPDADGYAMWCPAGEGRTGRTPPAPTMPDVDHRDGRQGVRTVETGGKT